MRYAFEYARANKRKKVTCFTKDNIMKITDGLFHRTFDEIAREYPDIESEHWIVDIGAAKMADTPEAFDMIVMPNLYGDVLSDVAAQITGSVGLAGSANIGDHCSMFEAIHGSAPRRAGQNLANPSGLLHGALLMLVHIGQPRSRRESPQRVAATIEDGIHTYDIYKEGVSKEKVGTRSSPTRSSRGWARSRSTSSRSNTIQDVQMNLAIRPAGKPPRRPAPASTSSSIAATATRDQIAVLMQQLQRRRHETYGHQQPRNQGLAERQRRHVLERSLVVPLRRPTASVHVASTSRSCSTRPTGSGSTSIKTEGLFTFDGERGYSLAQGE